MNAMIAGMLFFALIAFVAFAQAFRSFCRGYSPRMALYVMFGAIVAAFLFYFPAFGY
jgi:hypothetical protein